MEEQVQQETEMMREQLSRLEVIGAVLTVSLGARAENFSSSCTPLAKKV